MRGTVAVRGFVVVVRATMPVWHRALLVVSALPLVEVSCGGYSGMTCLHLVAEGESFRSPLAGAAAVVEAAAAGKVIGLASVRFFGLDNLGCAIASGDSAAADATVVMTSDAALSCGVSSGASHRFLFSFNGMVGSSFGRIIVANGMACVTCAIAVCDSDAAGAPIVVAFDALSSSGALSSASYRLARYCGLVGSSFERIIVASGVACTAASPKTAPDLME